MSTETTDPIPEAVRREVRTVVVELEDVAHDVQMWEQRASEIMGELSPHLPREVDDDLDEEAIEALNIEGYDALVTLQHVARQFVEELAQLQETSA